MDIVKQVEEQGIATDVQWHNTLIEMYYLNAAPGSFPYVDPSNVLMLCRESTSGTREAAHGSGLKGEHRDVQLDDEACRAAQRLPGSPEAF